MKTCRGCATDKPYSEFYTNPNVSDGHLNWCKPCVIARYGAGRKVRQRKLLEYIQAIKLERGCTDCGYRANAVALDFDHLPGHTKEHRLAVMAAGATKARIDAEIAKCEVVCANCHRIRTNERLQREEQANG
jgi:hypothetical protein